jgi:serine/threonine protein kinase
MTAQPTNAIIKVDKMVGAGRTADVYIGTYEDSGDLVTIKIANPENDESDLALEREATILASFKAPYIANLRISGFFKGHRINVLDYIEGSNLDEVMAAEGPMPFSRVYPIALQLAQALRQLHESGRVHGDLRPANVLLTRNHDLKLIDFGSSAFVGNADIDLRTVLRTANERRHPVFDVRSFARLILFLMTGRQPTYDIADGLLKGLAGQLPKDFFALLSQCLIQDPFMRPQNGRVLHEMLSSIETREPSDFG